MNTFTAHEIGAAKEIIAKGLQKAAESLSFFMKETITLRESDFSLSGANSVKFRDLSSEESLFVLITEIRGNIKGSCFLVFNKEEVEEICRVALPAEIVNNPDKLKGMQEPLLLEVDNIISASVITQIANSLNQKMYGDVPRLNILSTENLKKLIGQQVMPDKLIIGFQTEFISAKSHFHPEFFWILEPLFLDQVKASLLQKTN